MVNIDICILYLLTYDEKTQKVMLCAFSTYCTELNYKMDCNMSNNGAD